MYCVVQKSLEGKDRTYSPGRLINTSKWDPIRREQLISQRYLRMASEDEVTEARARRKVRRRVGTRS